MTPTFETPDGRVKLYLADCLDVLPTLEPGSVDAVVTSPPYEQQRDYGSPIEDWRSLVSGAMLSVQAHKETQFLVNLGITYRDGECSQYWDGLVEDMRTSGYRLFGWYVWDKGFGMPGNWSGRLAPAHEFVFHFNKQAVEPNKWVRTQCRTASGTGLRRADGTMSQVSSPDKCGQPFKIPDSVIRLPPHQLRGGPENEHPAIFPVALPEHLVRTFTDDAETILDPFMGSGTTGVAAVRLGRKFIGIEKETKYFEIAQRRIQEALGQEVAVNGVTQKRMFTETQ